MARMNGIRRIGWVPLIDTTADGFIDEAGYAAFQAYKERNPDRATRLRNRN